MASPDSKSSPLLDPEMVARLTSQPLVARFPMVGSVSGQHKSPHRGSSVEFAEYREYVPGDDLRRLDWRVFARSDRFYIKEFEADTNLRCHLVVDCSASMNFVGEHANRLEYAKRLAAALAYITIQQGDAAGVKCVGGAKSIDLPARRNPAHFQLILDSLEAAKPKGETKLPSVLHELAEKVRRRALVIVISDFFCDIDELLSCFQHLRFQKHDLAVFQLLDPVELDFQFDRPVRFNDLESSFSLVTEPAMIREQYLTELHKFLNRLREGCHEFGADYRRVTLDQPLEKTLSDFLLERARTTAVSPV